MMSDKWVSDCGTVTLYRGDCLEILPTLPEGIADAVVTDPPYSSGGAFRGDRTAKAITKYVNSESAGFYTDFGGDSRDQRSFLAWCSLWLAASWRAASAGGVCAIFSDWRQLPVMTDCVQAGGWVWRNIGTWWKPGCRMQKGRFSSSAEYVVYGTKGAHDSNGEQSPQNVISVATMQTDDKAHIAEKPLQVMEWVLGLSKAQAIVLDPFMGSGTTGVACVRLNRRFIGIEIDPGYFEIAKKRIQDELSSAPLFAEETKQIQAELWGDSEASPIHSSDSEPVG